jgi:hypothetical protein
MSFHEKVEGFNDDKSMNNKAHIKRQKNIQNMFHKERVKTRAGEPESPNFLSKVGGLQAKFMRKSIKENALNKAKK